MSINTFFFVSVAVFSVALGYRRHTSPTLANFTLFLDGANFNVENTRQAIYQGLSLGAKIGRNVYMPNTMHDTFSTNIFQYDDLKFGFDAENGIISLTMTNLQVQYRSTWFGLYEIPYEIICEGKAAPQVSIPSMTLQWAVSTDDTCLLYVDYLHPIITNDEYSVNYDVSSGSCSSLLDVFVGDLRNKMEHAVQYAIPNIVNNYVEYVLTTFIPTNITITGGKYNGGWEIEFGVCFEDIIVRNDQISSTVSLQFNQSLNQTFEFYTYDMDKHSNNQKNIVSFYWLKRILGVIGGTFGGAIVGLAYVMYIRKESQRNKASGKAIELINEDEDENESETTQAVFS